MGGVYCVPRKGECLEMGTRFGCEYEESQLMELKAGGGWMRHGTSAGTLVMSFRRGCRRTCPLCAGAVFGGWVLRWSACRER